MPENLINGEISEKFEEELLKSIGKEDENMAPVSNLAEPTEDEVIKGDIKIKAVGLTEGKV